MARDDITGVLLVGGASRRFGSPKALARFRGETLAERAYRTLQEAFSTVIVLGKTDDRLALPFPILDDGSAVRAPIAGVVAALRRSQHDVAVVLPTDMPFVTPDLLRDLADASAGFDVAHVQTGPLPGAYRRSARPVLERRLAVGELALRAAVAELQATVVPAKRALLRNVNRPDDLDG